MASVTREPAPNPQDVLDTIGWKAVTIAPVTDGWDAHLWRFSTEDGKEHALRLYRLGMSDEAGRAAMGARESEAIRVLREAGLPTPEVETGGTFEGSTFLVQRWLPGLPMLSHAEKRPWDTARMGRIFGRLQARMHSVPGDTMPGMPPDVAAYIHDMKPELTPLLEELELPTAVIHLDFHPLNVLVRNKKISGLVDFAFAAKGDPRLDLARTNATLVTAPLPPGPMKPILQQFRRIFYKNWREGYIAEAGVWPLDPMFEAFGAAFFLADIEYALREGRGWATEKDAETGRAYLEECCKRAKV